MLIHINGSVTMVKAFLSKYPLATHELIHFPLMYPDTLKKYRIRNIPYASLDLLYTYGQACGVSKGALRTTLSRMKKEESIIPVTTDGKPRYRVAPLQIEVMTNMQKKKKEKSGGFTVAIFSFEKSQERERSVTRSLLLYCGFVRFAQNAYINILGKDDQLRKSLNDAGVGDNVYLFNISEIENSDLKKLLSCWKIPERIELLNTFKNDTEQLIENNSLTDADLFFSIGIAWAAYIIHINSTEPPLPLNVLPKDYPYNKLYNYMVKKSIKYSKKMIQYWRSSNSI
ncbi:MAG: hypothetical protein JXK07_13625 [Spirochaetes bacterium]|nr:hypothetical protein [Spirochaetota bacterium]